MKKNEKKIQPTKFNLMGLSSGRSDWRAFVDNDVTKADILNPDFWSLVAGQMKKAGILPRIEIVPADLSWHMECVAINYGATHITMKEINYNSFTATKKKTVSIDDKDGFTIKWLNSSDKFGVLNKNGDLIANKLLSKEKAEVYLLDHKEKLGIS